ncbi:Pyruvate decarboxylase 1 [Geranomyces michiganensis]|nr:Pyruvate decarboxylase 1 [Geranomyces michiganensis]
MAEITETAKRAVQSVGKLIPRPLTVGNYLLARLHELGCHVVFGVPGDFNMEFLDQIEDFDGISWGYNANELNAGYAADGYARVKGGGKDGMGVGAVCTTFGVGELSCVNAIAGSQAEMVSVVHIVGTPSTVSQADGAILHHTLGNGDFRVFARMSEEITVAQASLTPENAAHEIDRVLRLCVLKRRPVYIALPTDVAAKTIIADMKPLNLTREVNPPDAEAEAVDLILKILEKAERPAILVDGCCQRFHVEKEVREFVEKSGFPVFSAPMGKTVVPDQHKQYRGAYVGSLTPAPIREELESRDVVLMIGAIKSDFNTGGFTFQVKPERIIELHSTYCTVFHARFAVGFEGVLKKLTERITHRPWTLPAAFDAGSPGVRDDSPTDITQTFFWTALGKHLANEPHCVVAETGTSSFGSSTLKLATGSRYVSQVLWGSIGYATAASLGTALAGRELEAPLRTVLVTGDGSFQLTAQEVSTFLRHKLTPIIIIINNDGYTIERYIHGEDRTYNRTAMWKYSRSLEYFSADQDKATYPRFGLQQRIERKQDVAGALSKAFAEKDAIHVLEVVMDKMDAPQGMVKTAEKTKAENKYNGDS